MLEKVGFTTGYAGGHSIGMMHYAISDYGLITSTEMVDQASRMSAAVNIPLIFDADEVGGTVSIARSRCTSASAPPASTWRTSGYPSSRPGVVACLLSIEDMQGRIAAAAAARTDSDFVILARGKDLPNKAWYNDGNIDEMVKRGQAYAEGRQAGLPSISGLAGPH